FAVPQREGEHSAKAIHALFAPSLPGVDDDFGVAARAEMVTQREKLRDQLLVVVNLPVVDDHHAAVFVEHRLLAGRKIDDREPTMTEPEARLDVQPALVGAAVMLRLVHARQQIPAHFPPLTRIEDADDAAHGPLGQPTARRPGLAPGAL